MKKKNIQIEFKNRKAFFNYEISDKIEAGIKLTGTEVKSARNGKVNLNGCYCFVSEDGLYIKGMDIAFYEEGSLNNHDPKRDRKLLLHKKQIERLKTKLEEKHFTIVPIRMYTNETGIFKMEIGLGKGRKKYDKRNYIRKRESLKELKNVV
jgi:SsrA-binding protein